MVTQSRDTNPEAEKVLISLLRKRSISEKLEQVLAFSNSIIQLSKRAISRANSHLSEKEKDLLFVKYHYGKELADKLRAYLKLNFSLTQNYQRLKQNSQYSIFNFQYSIFSAK